MLDILYQDEYLVAVNKPHGLLVHRSPIATDASEFALQILREQLERPVYPAHRIDRKTGGVLLFTLDKKSDSAMQQCFAKQAVDKTYLAVLRGYTDQQGTIDYPLRKENGVMQEALTRYEVKEQFDIDVALGAHPTSRYSLVRAYPKTGRMHQLRKHFAHILHPIIGDRPHGCNKQNRMWKELFQMETMLLHAETLNFKHPITDKNIWIEAPLQAEFQRSLSLLESKKINK